MFSRIFNHTIAHSCKNVLKTSAFKNMRLLSCIPKQSTNTFMKAFPIQSFAKITKKEKEKIDKKQKKEELNIEKRISVDLNPFEQQLKEEIDNVKVKY